MGFPAVLVGGLNLMCGFARCGRGEACDNEAMISYRFPFGAVLAAFALGFALVPQISSAAQVNVSMGPNYFTPSQITINVGDTVVWRNTDTMAHTVTADNGAFDSGTMQPNAAYSRNFTTPGTYSYRCIFHSGMVGTITVVGGSAPASPTPAYTSPSTADQLRAQAQALLARVQQLQAQLGQGGTTAPTGSVAYDASSCPLIGRSLKVGSSGDDVTRLQQFLARDPSIYPEGRVTGYYGALTESAVKRWQMKYNIVSSGTPGSTGYGVVGPRTAAAIAILCTTGSYAGVPGPTGGAPVGGFIQVTPVAGNAPLSVAVQATVNTVNSCVGATYTLDYGDGTLPNQIAVPAGTCTQLTQTLGHVYPYGGTFLVTLSAGAHRTSAVVQVYGAGPPTPAPTPNLSPTPSPTPSPSTTWGIVSVTPAVSGNPLAVTLEIEYPACAAYSIDWGDSSLPSSVGAQSGCSDDSARANVSHTYGGSGTYTVSLKEGSGSVKATAAVSISN